MDLIKAMTAFVRVAELGSFSAAARALHTTQPSISKLVSSLEDHLGGPLIERGTRTLAVTRHGRCYLPHAQAILAAVQDARDDFRSGRQRVEGMVRIGASMAFGRSQIIPSLPALLERHPDLQVDLHLSEQAVDLARERIDVAFRVAHLQDSALVARRIGMAPRLAVASPGYLQRQGCPAHPRDLAAHQCIYFAGIGSPRVWRFRCGERQVDVPLQGRFQVNAAEGVREAALAGLGVAVLPAWMLQDDIADGRLQPVLEGFALKPLPIYAVVLKSGRDAARNQAVVEHYAAQFARTFPREPGRPG